MILMFCVFAVTTGEFVVAGLLPDVAAGVGTTVGAAGQLVTAYALGMIVGGPLVTAATARLPRKPLMVGLLVVAALANAAAVLAPTFPVLLATRVAAGLTTGTFFAHAIVVAVRSARPDRAGSAVARLAFGMNLAMIVGAPLGTAVADVWGWRSTFAAVAVGCAIGAVLVGTSVVPDDDRRASVRGELRELVRPPVLLALAVTAVGNAGVLMVFSYLAPLMVRVAGHADGALPALILGYGIGATAGGLAGGAFFDRYPRAALPALLGALAVVLAAAWKLATAPLPAAIVVVLLGALAFAVVPGMQARVLAAATGAPTLAVAVNASGYQLAAAAAGLLGGLLVDSSAGPQSIYPAAAALTLGGLALVAVATRRLRVTAPGT
ncbi:MFS transporter [Pseudonocardia sp. CA-107938]|uniref:MFS transporter n=1 Tax=Pseudonocardia sp. CA-107938 TaxID=3240021 RepID=UPI003D8C8614